MSAIPAWLGATAGSQPQAGQINQFLGAHTSQYLYAAALTASQVVNGAGHINSNGQYLAQSFTTAAGQTAVGYVIAPITSFTPSGATLGPTTLSLYANSGGAPTGSPLVSTTITTEYAYAVSGGTFTVNVTYPLPATGLTPSTTYWLVLSPAGGASPHFGWQQSNQVTGASTSTNGTTWTAQAYGFQYQIFDQTVSGLQTASWEDSGARWTVTTYNTAAGINQLATYAEYTVAQGANAYVQSFRTLTYSNGLLAKVT